MLGYLLRRLLLIPLTLLCILLVNFTILNFAPGDPSTVSTSAMSGDGARRSDQGSVYGSDDPYFMFRERYGLTLPVLLNFWPRTSKEWVESGLSTLSARRRPGESREMSAKAYSEFRVRFGDRARYFLPILMEIAEDPLQPHEIRALALRFAVRGGTRLGETGHSLTSQQRDLNRRIARSNQLLRSVLRLDLEDGIVRLRTWWETNQSTFPSELSTLERLRIMVAETRIARYLTRVLTLDFGTLRNDANRTVIREVASRLKYSLTLAALPMALTFVFCQFFGFLMAVYQNRWPDLVTNIVMLLLYALPVFVVAPFLIEKVALHTSHLPISGFHSGHAFYAQMNSWERFSDIALHIFLPLVAIMYGTLAVQARLSRTAVLEVLRQDYVRTARAKGVPRLTILWKHVGRNAAITVVTSIAASLGVILGGSLIVETLFDIDGFGRFFYHAILNRDFNVIMFSALAGAALSLVGYLVADLAYTLLDPRVTLE